MCLHFLILVTIDDAYHLEQWFPTRDILYGTHLVINFKTKYSKKNFTFHFLDSIVSIAMFLHKLPYKSDMLFFFTIYQYE